MRLFLALILALSCTAVSAREVYKWVDKNGVTHYGDKPKHGGEAVDATPPGGDAPAVTPEQEKAQAARASQCEALKKQLDTYAKATTIKERDALGREKEYSADERKQLVSATEQKVKETCSPAPPASAGDAAPASAAAPATPPATP